jgi:hypothetical protein
MSAARCDVYLAAEDGLQTPIARVIVKGDRREEVAMLRDRQRWHLQLDRFVEQLLNAARPVEERELSVQMKVDELCHVYSHSMVEGGFEEMS